MEMLREEQIFHNPKNRLAISHFVARTPAPCTPTQAQLCVIRRRRDPWTKQTHCAHHHHHAEQCASLLCVGVTTKTTSSLKQNSLDFYQCIIGQARYYEGGWACRYYKAAGAAVPSMQNKPRKVDFWKSKRDKISDSWVLVLCNGWV